MATAAATTPSAPPAIGAAEWHPGSSTLQVTVTNPSSEATGHLALGARLSGGAVASGAPSGCEASVVVLWVASCALAPLPAGATRTVTVPVTPSVGGRAAVTLCPTGLLGVECVAGALDTATVELR